MAVFHSSNKVPSPGCEPSTRANLKIRVELLALLYIPAAALQLWLYTRARGMTGTMTYEVIPLTKLIPLSLLLNAPVSLITGILFPLTCQQLANNNNNPLHYRKINRFKISIGAYFHIAFTFCHRPRKPISP